jgi:8-oxo-dGTP pyrophosphatase MutT (NUDIX family)
MAGRRVTRGSEEVSAGGVVMRRSAAGPEVLVAEQRDRNLEQKTLRLPKGHLEPGETAEAAACREVAEEVGVAARVVAALPDAAYRYVERGNGRTVAKRVHFFLMAYESGAARPVDGEMTAVYWLPLDEAEARLSFETERAVVARARALLDSADPPRL